MKQSLLILLLFVYTLQSAQTPTKEQLKERYRKNLHQFEKDYGRNPRISVSTKKTFLEKIIGPGSAEEEILYEKFFGLTAMLQSLYEKEEKEKDNKLCSSND